MKNQIYWVWLTSLLNINSYKITNLLTKFDSAIDIYNAKDTDYNEIYGINKEDISVLSNKDLEKAEAIINKTKLIDAYIITYEDINYPDMLRQMENPPYILYMKGELMQWDRLLMISVVGTRRYNDYGLYITKTICTGLAKAGITIVSGMARGLDSLAGASALRAGNKTIAVLGCGIDIVYPPEHKNLMDAIIKNGTVITEYPPGTPPMGRNFPERNRIISGLSRGTLVMQAPLKSGALITANYALDSGKDVFAVPGDITSVLSAGTNSLIKAGAKLVENAQDILEEYTYEASLLQIPIHKEKQNLNQHSYPIQSANPQKQRIVVNNVKIVSIDDDKYRGLNESEKKIISILIENTTHIDDIVRQSELPAHTVNSTLTILEMKNLISQLPGKNFRLQI